MKNFKKVKKQQKYKTQQELLFELLKKHKMLNSQKIMSAFNSNGFKDIIHEDGSKSYENVCGGYITIKRPEIVEFVERILNQNFTGWSYASTVDEAFENGFITDEEARQIYRILD